ncbi:aminofutalosine synthase MqnE [bacterium]|nr:aminofutalosine synthase MqnE [bacterium]|tara:strand:+ start:10751 stop:11902 length:1152 start_codon:yes stop_codon:yes gene_type:complete
MPETADILLKNHPDNWAWEKIKSGERITYEEGVRLIKEGDLTALGIMADYIRRKRWGNKSFYGNTSNINHTNECILDCGLCAFKRPFNPKKMHEESYIVDKEELEKRVDWAVRNGIWEIHIVGGITPRLKLDYYKEFLQTIKRKAPHMFIQGFTAIEIRYIAKLCKITPEELLVKFKKWGLDSVPGGGAEIFHERPRQIIARNKETGEEWLEIHEITHKVGMNSNATMLYGHIETKEEIIHHLDLLRKTQDKTNGFLALIPLAFLPDNTEFEDEVGATTGHYDARICAISRIYLDNFPHIRILWTYQGPKMTQVLLHYGVDDVGGTSLDEEIAKEAGGFSSNEFTQANLMRILKESGRKPVPVNSVYSDAPSKKDLMEFAKRI